MKSSTVVQKKRLLKNWITEYLQFTSHSEAPKQFNYWTAISVIAGALRRKVWIDQRYFIWTPNFFIFFVAPAGIVNKTTAAKVGHRLLKALGKEELIFYGAESTSWQSLIKDMAAKMQHLVEIPGEEGLNHCSVNIIAGELGTFLDPRDRGTVNMLTNLWDGWADEVFDKSSKTQGSESLTNPWINLIGCCTPAWIADNMDDYFSGGGLASRVVFVYSEDKERLIAYPALEIEQKDFDKKRKDLIHDLYLISKIAGQFHITKEGTDWGKAWYEEHYRQFKTGGFMHLSSQKFQGYIARKQGHVHKLAMCLSAAESDDKIVQKRHIEDATKVVTELEKDMPKVYGMIAAEGDAVVADDIYNHLLMNGKKIERTILYRHFWRTISYTTFEKALISLHQAGLISPPTQGKSGTPEANKMYINVRKEK